MPDTGPTRIGPSETDAGPDARAMAPPPPPPADPLPASCEEVTFDACGGDPVGVWSARLGCVDYGARSPFPDCPAATLDIAIVLSGRLEIRASSTYSSATDIASTTTARVPTACAGADCSGLGEGARLEAGVCVQTAMDHQMPADEGVWRFEGGFVVLQTAGESTRYQHCVSGDRMTLVAPAAGPNDAQITLVFERMD